MSIVLDFIVQFLSNPTILIALLVMIGLLLQKKDGMDVLKGTLKTIVGFTLISSGSGIVTESLTPLNTLLTGTFSLSGTLPVNESCFAVAAAQFGTTLSGIMALVLVVNLVEARFSKFKFVYLTGHEVMWVSTVCAISLGLLGMPVWQIIVCGGLITGTYMAVAPALLYKTVCEVTGSRDLAVGHSGIIYYWLAMLLAKVTGNKEKSAEDIKISSKVSVLRDMTISLSLAMIAVYLIVSVLSMILAPELAAETFGGTNVIIFSITYGVEFAASIYVIQAGVRIIVSELTPAFKGVADKLIPNAIPALDIPILYPFQPNSVLVGFLCAAFGGILAFFLQIALIGTPLELPLILPTLFTAFFYGATSGCVCNKVGGLRGVIIGSVFTGFTISLFPALLIQFGNVLVDGTTFGGSDAAVIGIFNTQVGAVVGNMGLVIISVIIFAAPILYSVLTKNRPGMTERE